MYDYSSVHEAKTRGMQFWISIGWTEWVDAIWEEIERGDEDMGGDRTMGLPCVRAGAQMNMRRWAVFFP